MGKKKADIEYPFDHGEVINFILDGVSIHPVTTKLQVSFLTQLAERKETQAMEHLDKRNGSGRTKGNMSLRLKLV